MVAGTAYGRKPTLSGHCIDPALQHQLAIAELEATLGWKGGGVVTGTVYSKKHAISRHCDTSLPS